jgi:hypothetical protein
MNLLGLRKLIGDMLSSPARPTLHTEDVLNVDFVNPLEKPGPWALDVLVNDSTGTDATRTFRVTVEEKQEEPTFDVRLTREQVLAILRDGQEESFPSLDSADETATFFADMNNWWKANRDSTARQFLAQTRGKHEDSPWITMGRSEESARDAAWGQLTDEMQRKGLRSGELAEHIKDMEKGETLTAEDGSLFRIISPGQKVTK